MTGPELLVLRALGLGDALTAVPALRGLRRAYPDHRLVLAGTEPVSGWLRDLGLVDAVVRTDGLTGPPPGRRAGRHLAVNLHGAGPESHRLLLAGAPDELLAYACEDAGVTTGPAWPTDAHEVDRWCALVRVAGGWCGPEDLRLPVPKGRQDSGVVVLHPGASTADRQWPAGSWIVVAASLAAAGHRIVVTGGRAETGLVGRVVAAAGLPASADTTGRLTLHELADVVAGARLVLSGDTGIAHLATAYGRPSVVVFGPEPPARWRPLIDEDRHVVLEDRALGRTARTGAAAAVSPAEVVEAAERLIRGVPVRVGGPVR